MGDALTWTTQKAGIGAWEPHWLGEPGRHLYASLHRAGAPGARLGVLFAAPLFHEQPRSRRLLAEVASGLAAMGLPSLRFDFFGTGDSAGNSEQTDFSSMCSDLTLAARALRASAGVDQVAVLAWRGAALPVARWVRDGGMPALTVLWEPIVDGAQWLQELERADAAERSSGRYRADWANAVPRSDQQLMGLAVSPRLRAELADARLTSDGQPHGARYWGVLRSAAPTPALKLEQVFDLPQDSPTFGDSLRMDSGLFVTSSLKRVAEELGHALQEVG